MIRGFIIYAVFYFAMYLMFPTAEPSLIAVAGIILMALDDLKQAVEKKEP